MTPRAKSSSREPMIPDAARAPRASLRRLSSGYWMIAWTPMVWAQGRGAVVTRDDFFQPDWSCTPAREQEANALLQGETHA